MRFELDSHGLPCKAAQVSLTLCSPSLDSGMTFKDDLAKLAVGGIDRSHADAKSNAVAVSVVDDRILEPEADGSAGRENDGKLQSSRSHLSVAQGG